MKEISKRYDHNEVEDKIYELWEKSGFFNPDKINSRKKYSNVLPPPNANGELHLGNASGEVVMDIFGRYHRMKGEKTLLLPGKDHAGILTQVVYERKLKEERGITRQKLGREKFYTEVYDFCLDRANYMRAQEKKIGVSADWSRERFTLDPEISKTVLETFVKMHREGLVYKGDRIINWCPRCGTALSDLEVIHKKTPGKLYYIKYPIKNTGDFIIVATTRPETMLGDAAVAVNPKDKKSENMVGKTAILPLIKREIPIIADRRIEMDFGTGAVKITPAHDPLDWKIGKEHKLPVFQVVNEKAQITELGGKYAGLGINEARDKILNDLKNLNLLEKEEDTEINISICERCKGIIEPLISNQWFINVDAKHYSLKNKSLEAIKTGKIKIYPENFKKILIQWFENLEDWCISRQIWWGHRFPVWYKKGFEKEIYVGLNPPKGKDWIREEFTFDTWFSSGQWAYTTLGYSKGDDYKVFYPTDMMIMGRDILFFWSARMIMMSLYRTKKVPFKNLYFTGLIRDKEGYKMSKSRGNSIDPLEMIEKYGADALRLSLITNTTPGLDTRLYEEKIERYRNFVTKLWNIYRYAAGADTNFALAENINKKNIKSLADRWIISRLNETILDVTKMMGAKKISMAENILINLTWNELADWYLEIHKIEKNNLVLGYILDKVLKLWHPFTPFVTEKIYSDLTGREKLLMIQKWPKSGKKRADKRTKREFKKLQDTIIKIRNLRSSYHINPADAIDAYGFNVHNKNILERLARIKIISGPIPQKTIKISNLNLDIVKLIDVQKEIVNLEKEIKNLENLISKTKALLVNENFLKKADSGVINEIRTRIKEYNKKLQVQRDLLNNLQQL